MPDTNPQYPTTDTTKTVAELKKRRPGNGRAIKEDGSVVNLADAFKTESGQLKLRVSGADKVRYNADDTSAGYLADKIVAGTGITLAEGTGTNADKLEITASGGGGGGTALTVAIAQGTGDPPQALLTISGGVASSTVKIEGYSVGGVGSDELAETSSSLVAYPTKGANLFNVIDPSLAVSTAIIVELDTNGEYDGKIQFSGSQTYKVIATGVSVPQSGTSASVEIFGL